MTSFLNLSAAAAPLPTEATVPSGAASASTGTISASAGTISASAGTISASAGTISASAGLVSPAAGLVSPAARTTSTPAEGSRGNGEARQPEARRAEARQPEARPEAPAEARPQEDPVDFEIVFGRRQIASTGLVLVSVLAVISGVSYLIGKAAAGSEAPAQAAAPVAATVTPKIANVETPAIPVAAVTPAAAATLPAPSTPPAATVQATTPSSNTAPLFGEAVTGKIYLQVGVIDKGLAGIWAEGLRTHGLDAFVSSGPGANLWRVLIGPLPDPQSYERSKAVLDHLGINTFGRKYPDK